MDLAREELEDAKAEIEKLKEESRSKSEQSENLKRAYNDQINKIHEMNSKIQKQNQDLIEKADEVSVTKKMYEDLEFNLKEKDNLIKHLSSQNEKLRVDSQEKIKKYEEEKRELVLAVEEENENNLDKEEKIRSLKEENELLKERVFKLQKVGVEAKENAKASKELRVRDEVLVKFEDEKQKLEVELKWKKEKFEHLKEAHDKLRAEIKAREREWEKEKCMLINEIAMVQTKLDSEIKLSEDLKSRLEMCKQALAHEESRRRNLEVKVSESTACFENVFAGNKELESNLKSLVCKRDKEIAALRDLMGTMESDYKEMEYRLGKVEKENEELKASMKELHEDQIREARACTPISKPRSKTKSKSLETVHRECLNHLEAKEAEWGSQVEKLREELGSCRCELKGKDELIYELKQESECMKNLEAELCLQVEKLREELGSCRYELKGKDELINELKQESQCMKNLEAELCSQVEKLREELGSCRYELKGKDELINELKQESQCMKNLEAELCSQVEKLREELGSCRYELKGKDEFINELKQESECMKNLEAELCLQIEKMVEELGARRFELKGKDELIIELKEELEKFDSSTMELVMKNEESFVMALVLESVFEETRMKFDDKKAKMDLHEVEGEDEREESLALIKKELDGYKEKVLKMKMEYNQVSDALDRANGELAHKLPLVKKELDEYKEKVLKMKGEHNQVCDALDRANEELALKFIEMNEVEFELQIWKSIAERLKSDLEENHQMRREMQDSLLAQVSIEVDLKEENKMLADKIKIKGLESNSERGLVYEACEKIKMNDVMKEMEIQENILVFQELKAELEAKELEVKRLTHLTFELFDRMRHVFNQDNELMRELGRIVETCNENGTGIDLDQDEELFGSEKENAEKNCVLVAITKTVEMNVNGRSPLKAINS